MGHLPSLTMDDRRGVAVVCDPVERDVPQPPRRLARRLDQPRPIFVCVDVDLAVRFADPPRGDDRVMKSAPVRAPGPAIKTVELFGRPPAISMACGRIKPVRLDPVLPPRKVTEADIDRSARRLHQL